MDSRKVPQRVDIDFLIFSWTTGNWIDLSTMFSTEIGGLIFPWGWRNNNHRNYVNQLLLQPNTNEMKNTQFHSQENMATNNCGQQEFDLPLQEWQEHSNRILMFQLNICSDSQTLETSFK